MGEIALRDYLTEIDGLIERNMLDVAIKHCRHILTQYPKCVDVYRLLGKALLEQDEDQSAQDVFQRVLSVDPEDFVARVGLAIVFDRNNQLDKAIWHMERAYDIAPSNALIQGELRRLYVRRDGESPERIPLTRSALARMYARGDLYSEAIANLRQLLREQPDRLDLQVGMAEVLWRDDQRVEAAEWIQLIMRDLPYCLKANLILGFLLRESGVNGESDEPFRRAQAVDPENVGAAALYGSQGPLAQQTIMVDRLDLQTVSDLLEAELPVAETEEEVPIWLRGLTDLEPPPPLAEPEVAHAPRLPSGAHMPEAEGEVPDWLQGLAPEGAAAAEAEVPDWLAALTGAAAAGAVVEAVSDREHDQSQEIAVKPSDEVVPDWIAQLGAGTSPLAETDTLPEVEEEAQPDWLAQLHEQPPAPFSESVPVQEDTEMPDWLAQLQAAQKPVETAAPETEEAQPTDWLTALQAAAGEAEVEDEHPALDLGEAALGAAAVAGAAWLGARGTEEAEVEETPSAESGIFLEPTSGAEQAASFAVAEPEKTEIPEEMPSADDALDFLAKLAAGKEDQLRAQAQEEADVRMAEIMGRKPAAAVPEEKPQLGVAAAGAALAGAVIAGAVAKQEPLPSEIKAEPAPPTVPAAEVPETMPSADDALAFLAKLAAGKEDQLRAQAQQEADTRMAEIMGRKPEAAPAPQEKPAPIKMTVPAATVAALAAGLAGKKERPAEPPPPVDAQAEIPEALPSADDALAFLTKLAAGKEDQLRAQAQQEAEDRMAVIMGRKPESKPAELAIEASQPAPVAEPTETSLAELAESKEEQLRAQAELEAEARMAAILGRTGPMEQTGPLQGPGAAPAPQQVMEAAGPASEVVLPDWLQAVQSGEGGTPVETPEGELPEWLRAMRPEEGAAGPGLVALFEEPEPAEPTSAADLPDWLRAVQPVETVFDETRAEEMAEPELKEPAALEETVARSQVAALVSPDWWVQVAADTEEEPLHELPEPYLSPRARAAEKAAVVAKSHHPEDKSLVHKVPQTGPLRQTGPVLTPELQPAVVAAATPDIEQLLSRIYRDQQDYAARLDLARMYWATGNREGAYQEYAELVTAGEFTKETMADLETIVEVHDQPDWHRMLGDVYMKAGRLSHALSQYRKALNEIR